MEPSAVARIAEASVACERATGCPAELIAAQCALESGWLRASPGNNCFGIKAYPGCFGTQMLTTREHFTNNELRQFLALGGGRTARPAASLVDGGRREYVVTDAFATFPTLADCFERRAAMWDHGPYAEAAERFKRDRDLTKFVRAIGPIYATDPAYAETVLLISRQDNLKAAINAARGA